MPSNRTKSASKRKKSNEEKNEEEKPKYDLLFNPSPEFLKKVEENEKKRFEEKKWDPNPWKVEENKWNYRCVENPSKKVEENEKKRYEEKRWDPWENKWISGSVENPSKNPPPSLFVKDDEVKLIPMSTEQLCPLTQEFNRIHRTINRSKVLEKMKSDFHLNVSNGLLTIEDYLEISSTFYCYIAKTNSYSNELLTLF